MAEIPTDSNSAPKSFCKSLFHGDILEDALFPYPKMGEEDRESVRMFLEALGKFRATVDSRRYDEDGHFPEGFIEKVGQLGLWGLLVPHEHGGLGLSSTGSTRIMEEVSTIDGSLAVTLGAHQSIGFKALTLFGTKEQKARFYPRLATGELLGCFALTEPGSGSDAGSIKSKAVLSADGRNFLLNGQKVLITNSGIANFVTVFAKTDEPDGKEKVTAFMVELPFRAGDRSEAAVEACRKAGVRFGTPEDKMGIRASVTAAMYFEDVKIPVENVVGGRGKGFKVAMEVLNNGRMGLGGGCVGGSKMLLRKAVEQAAHRKQFGRPIAEFGMIQKKIGQMAVETFVSESMVYMTTSLLDRGKFDYSLESAITKVFCTESLWRTVNETMQIYGGTGYMRECEIERVLRDSRISMVYEGTNEILRVFIALAGLQGPGQALAEVAKALKEPVKQLGILSGYAAKTLKLNVMGASLTQTHPLLKRQAGVFEDYVAEFALQCSKLLQRHGKAIAEKQFACHRVADIAIDLYGMACVLSRVTSMLGEKGAGSCEEELALASSFFTQANRRMRGNFKAIDRNDDEEIKLIARRHIERGGYRWDLI